MTLSATATGATALEPPPKPDAPPEPRRRAPRGAPTPPRPPTGEISRLTLRVSVLLIGLITTGATATRATAAAPARRWLDYPFTGVPARLGESAAILAHNGRALLGVFGLLLIAQVAMRAPEGAGRVQRALQSLGEAVLAGLTAANTLLVGAGLGAYGSRMARAMLPHGPVELAAFARALALYLQGRRRALPLRYLVATGATSVVLLAGAAILETYVSV
jgi:hypothetical protein